jgi:hypothetical protein
MTEPKLYKGKDWHEWFAMWCQFPGKWEAEDREAASTALGRLPKEIEELIKSRRLSDANLVGRSVVTHIKKDSTNTPGATLVFRDTGETIIPPKPPSFIDNLVYQSSSSVIIAKPKMGKTTLMLDACEAVLMHKDFLKLPTTPTNILYISEQFLSSFVTELGNSGLLTQRNDAYGERLRYVTAEDWYKLSWEQIVELTVAEAVKFRAGLVVFDTLSRIARLENENDASEMQAAVDITTALIKEKIAVKFVQHERKAGGDIFSAGRGTNALMGAVDCVLRLGLPPVGNQPANYRVLEYIGRFPGPREPLIITRESADNLNRYSYVGTEFAVKSNSSKQQVLNLWSHATETENDWLTTTTVMDNTELSKMQASRALNSLAEDGDLEQRGDGRKGSPHEYRRRFQPVVF